MKVKKFFGFFRFSCGGAVVGSIFAASAALLNWDLFEAFVKLVAKGEAFELDELILPIGFVLLGMGCDLFSSLLYRRQQTEKLFLYNKMNGELVEVMSSHITKLLEFRLTLAENAPDCHAAHRDLDVIIVRSFKKFEHAQMRADINMSLLPLVVGSEQVSTPATLTVAPEANKHEVL